MNPHGEHPAADDRYRLLFERSPVAMAFVAPDFRILAANEALCRFLGRSIDEVVGVPGMELVHPDDRTKTAGLVSRLAEGSAEEVSAQRRYLRPDGSVVWGLSTTQAVLGPDGRLLYSRSVIVDVTDRVLAEQAQARLASVVQSSPDAILSLEESGRICLVNTQAERLFGYASDELVGQSINVLFPANAEAVRSGRRAAFTAGLVPGADAVMTEATGRCRDGREFPAEISLSSTQGDQGQLVWAAIRDGTERQQAAIVASSSDAIVGRSLGGTITSWNGGAERMYGYTAAEAVGTELACLVPPGHSHELPEMVERVRRGEPVEHYETQRVRKDGVILDVSVTMSPIHDRTGVVMGTSTVARDITEAKRAEAERQALEERLRQSERLESLGQLAGGVAHDFNNLLAVILNYAAFVAEETADDPAVHADVEHIRAAAERGARLTRQLLIVGRRDAAQPAILDLNAVVADIRELLSRTIGEHIELTVRSVPVPTIRVDRGKIEQVLLNLAVNARDAMPGGGTLVITTRVVDLDEDYIRLHPEARIGRHVELSVSDTGVGMAPDVVRRIFEPFYTTKAKGRGTGLGLATVHGIVTEAEGSLGVYSEVGIGTTFRVLLPAVDQPATEVSGPSAGGVRGNGETILVVEDDPNIMEVAARILRRSGYAVLEATTGSEAMMLVAEAEVGLMLTDSVMPHMSGQELARRVRTVRPQLPVVFMSGYDQGVTDAQNMVHEEESFLQKPFDARSLLERVQAALAGGK